MNINSLINLLAVMGLNWCKYITHEEIAATFAYGLPIISVGSGSGLHERKLENILGKPIICVDPLVEKFINVDQLPREIIDATNELCTGDNPGDFNNIARKVIFDYRYEVGLFHMPNYKLVHDLIVAKPELVGANHLLIIWSSPNDSTYDYDAIMALKPKYVTIVYDSTGAAGGENLQQYIMSLEPEQFIVKKRNSIFELDRFSIDLICIKV